MKNSYLKIFTNNDLNKYRKSIFSQFGEDGIINYIFKKIGVQSRYALEFGGHDGIKMSNIANLVKNKGWRGAFIEADEILHNQIVENYKNSSSVTSVCRFVLPSNVEAIFGELGVPKELDLLSIDIDGNDYWVWKEIKEYKARVVVIEYNAHYPPPRKWVMKLNESHVWRGDDYFGASLQSLVDLGNEKGYQLICCEEMGSNAFFVQKELIHLLGKLPENIGDLYRPPRFNAGKVGHPHFEGEYDEI